MLLLVLTLISAGAFLYYGFETLFRLPPRQEYERMGMARLRAFVGYLQLLGALGVLSGLVFAPIGAVAAASLTLMMVLGLVLRHSIHDPLRLMLPAASLASVNALLLATHIVG